MTTESSIAEMPVTVGVRQIDVFEPTGEPEQWVLLAITQNGSTYVLKGPIDEDLTVRIKKIGYVLEPSPLVFSQQVLDAGFAREQIVSDLVELQPGAIVVGQKIHYCHNDGGTVVSGFSSPVVEIYICRG